MDAVDRVEAAQSAAHQQNGGVEEAQTQLETSIMSTNGAEETVDDDKFTVQFSKAQLKTKIAQAKHETKLAADVELLAVKKELVEQRYAVADRERERDKVVMKCEALQKRLEAVLKEHKQTLLGMREDLRLEKLLATLEMEKATRQKLQEAFEKQQQTLFMAQERVEKLDGQVANYQKTETVLAQSVAHLQHRFASKDQQRAASVEHVQRELVEQHEQEMTVLREELAIARSTEKMAQGQLQGLQKEVNMLRDNAQQALTTHEKVETREHELQAKIVQLETEKAVLHSKAEQVQKVDAQLRNQVHAQGEEIVGAAARKGGIAERQ